MKQWNSSMAHGTRLALWVLSELLGHTARLLHFLRGLSMEPSVLMCVYLFNLFNLFPLVHIECVYVYHSITLSASVSIRIYRSLGTIILTSHSRNGRPDSGDLPVILSYFRSLMALGLHQVLRKSGGSSPNQCWEIEQESNWGWPWFWMILALPGCQFSLWHRNTCGKPLQSLGSCSML